VGIEERTDGVYVLVQRCPGVQGTPFVEDLRIQAAEPGAERDGFEMCRFVARHPSEFVRDAWRYGAWCKPLRDGRYSVTASGSGITETIFEIRTQNRSRVVSQVKEACMERKADDASQVRFY